MPIYDGFQNFAEARAKGKGVLFLTAHFGGWEIGSFVHSINGNPMNIVVRPLDNPYVDAFVDGYRTLHGNRTFGKQDFARGLIKSMKRGEVVGILMDTNMTPPQGAFVDFFGVPACTATGVARVALHTGAAVLPAFTIWDKDLGKYKIRFDPALQLTKTGDDEADALANTALFTKVIESYARRYPEQWLWVHRRWKARPPGESFTLLAKSTQCKRAHSHSCALFEERLADRPSVADRLAYSSFRLVFFEKINGVFNECHNCHDDRSCQTDKEKRFKKKYKIMQHGDCLQLIQR